MGLTPMNGTLKFSILSETTVADKYYNNAHHRLNYYVDPSRFE